MSTKSETPVEDIVPMGKVPSPVGDASDSNSLANASPGDMEEIEGGQISLRSEPVSWKEKHDTETAKSLTFFLVWILAGSVALHYVGVIILTSNGNQAAVEVLSKVFDSWLPVISGFVGGAVTFYLTRGKG